MTPWRLRSWFSGSRDRDSARSMRLRAVVGALARACERRRPEEVAALLGWDVRLVVDSGGTVPAALSDVRGAVPAAAALMGVLSLFPGAVFDHVEVNGMPALALREGTRVVGVITVAVRRRAVYAVWMVVNPAKLAHWNR